MKKFLRGVAIVVGSFCALIIIGLVAFYFVIRSGSGDRPIKASQLGTTVGRNLQARVANLEGSASCRGFGALAVPGPSPAYPLPAILNGKQVYRVFFVSVRRHTSALERPPVRANQPPRPRSPPDTMVGKAELSSPLFAGQFDASNSSSDVHCESYSAPGLATGQVLGAPLSGSVAKMEVPEYRAAQRALFDALARAAQEYFANANDSLARTTARGFYRQFVLLSEPPLRPHYRELSPGFWQWVQQQSGFRF